MVVKNGAQDSAIFEAAATIIIACMGPATVAFNLHVFGPLGLGSPRWNGAAAGTGGLQPQGHLGPPRSSGCYRLLVPQVVTHAMHMYHYVPQDPMSP